MIQTRRRYLRGSRFVGPQLTSRAISLTETRGTIFPIHPPGQALSALPLSALPLESRLKIFQNIADMKSFLAFLLFLFVLFDSAVFFYWWTHPKGAKQMGFSGKVPFTVPFPLPWAAGGGKDLAEAPAEGAEDQASGEPGADASAKPQVKTAAAPAQTPGGRKGAQPTPAKAGKPGGCRTAKQCSQYCLDTAHRDECQNYCMVSAHRKECLRWDKLISRPEEAEEGAAPAEAPAEGEEGSGEAPAKGKKKGGLLDDDAFGGI